MIPLCRRNSNKVIFSHDSQKNKFKHRSTLSTSARQTLLETQFCINPTMLDYHKQETLYQKLKASKFQLSLQEASKFRSNSSIHAHWRNWRHFSDLSRKHCAAWLLNFLLNRIVCNLLCVYCAFFTKLLWTVLSQFLSSARKDKRVNVKSRMYLKTFKNYSITFSSF